MKDSILSENLEKCTKTQIVEFAHPMLFQEKSSSFLGFENQCQQLLAQKLFSILERAVAGASEVISISSIALFLKYLWHRTYMIVEEGIILVAFLEKFVRNQTARGVKILNTKNIGTMLIVLVIVTMKSCRDKVCLNQFYADEFEIPSAVLNQSETTFLKVIKNEMWIGYSDYSLLFDEIKKVKDTQITN
ncbi:MAG: hypothetical protein EZS28_005315 [Streblomastix strix]|uniref:Cyclin N-terminal domain-containing protein n=1 Tax=Streblomastix strix TaxID=222440 RepID=A0A5J4WW38_9EUKA|nr:MAG: hypothetical protein EZS28_005315 [Streblomastix strix]